MKKEYDFPKGVRGKFYRPDIELNLPVYLDSDISKFMREYAKKKKVDTQTVVNELLRKDIELVKAIS